MTRPVLENDQCTSVAMPAFLQLQILEDDASSRSTIYKLKAVRHSEGGHKQGGVFAKSKKPNQGYDHDR